jgi:CHAD domain-containing protein
MNINEVQRHAHTLYAAHGDQAEYEAAQNELTSVKAGKSAEAGDWHRIRSAIKQIRGANES